MAFLSSLDISGSGMTAQKKRMDIISENITNRETLRTEEGGPYRRKLAVFQEIPSSQDFSGTLRNAKLLRNSQGTKGGVLVSEIIEDQSDFIPVYDPTHPDADDEGYVFMPNVNTTTEMVDMMAATRSFSANVAAFEAMKTIAKAALNIGK